MNFEEFEKHLEVYNPVEIYNKKQYEKFGLSSEYNYAWDVIEGRASSNLRRDNDETFIVTGITDIFPEDRYFRFNQDISILKHDRYAYPFLHKHSFFELCYVLKGEFEHEVEGKRFKHHQGDIVFLPPNVKHALFVFSDCIILNLLIKSSHFDARFRSFFENENVMSKFFYNCLYSSDDSSSILIFPTHNDSNIKNMFLNIYNENLNAKPYYEKITNHLLKLLFYQLLRDYEGSVQQCNFTIYNDKMATIMQYIRDNFATVTLDEVANKYFFNKYYLSRLIKEKTGYTFSTIVKNVRLEVSRQLIENTNLSFFDISRTVGYTDTTHLFRIFKKQYNISPKEYRNLKAKGSKPETIIN